MSDRSIRQRSPIKSGTGFTLIELMIVILVIGILGAVSLPVYQSYVVTAGAGALVEEIGEFSLFYRTQAVEQNLEFCDMSWNDVGIKSTSDAIPGLFPRSDFLSLNPINLSTSMDVLVEGSLEKNAQMGIGIAKALRVALDQKGLNRVSGMSSSSIEMFVFSFNQSCSSLEQGSLTSPSNNSAPKSPDRGIGVPITSETNLTALVSQTAQPLIASPPMCQKNEQLYQGACVQLASCSGGQLAADPSRCASCGSGKTLVAGQCVTPVECSGGTLSPDAQSCQCPSGSQLYQGACVQLASCSGGQLAADPSRCASCGSGKTLVAGQCVTPVECSGGTLSPDAQSCRCPTGQVLSDGACGRPSNSRSACLSNKKNGNGSRAWSPVALCMGLPANQWRSARDGN